MGSRIDWFDESVVEEPFRPSTTTSRALVPSHSADSEPRSRDQNLTFRGNANGDRRIGFMRLSNLADMNGATIILQLANSKHLFYDLLGKEQTPDYYVLIARIISKISDDVNSETKRLILEKIYMHSNFWSNISFYLQALPTVRIKEKNKNMHFWNDPESFYSDTLTCLEVFLTMFPEQLNTTIMPLFCDLQESIVGVTEMHSERFSIIFLERMESFQLEMLRTEQGCKKKESLSNTETADLIVNFDDYKNISVYPLLEDLYGETPKLEYIKDTPYDSFLQYVDRQFRMLREDYYGLLRVDIKEHFLNPKNDIYQNIQIHKPVRFTRSTVVGMKIGYIVKLNYLPKKQTSCLSDNPFIFGSLVIFTRDNFKTILSGTVIERDPAGSFVVELPELKAHHEIYDHSFTLVECKVFFEAYRHVLSVLQNLQEDEMPFKEYIMKLSNDVKIPSYVMPTAEYVIDLGKHNFSVNVNDNKTWPDVKDVNMDAAQYECFRAALCRELSIIHGPPGTGKTFMGLQIVKTLLQNINLEGPILVICYTNHALDQFLEATLEFTKNAVRIGSQSKNSNLDAYNISSLRAKLKSQHKTLYNEKKKLLEETLNEMNDIQMFYEVIQNELISYETLCPFMNNEMRLSLCKITVLENDPIFLWLFGSTLGYTMDRIGSVSKNDKSQQCNDNNSITLRSCFTVEHFERDLEQLEVNSKHISKDETYEKKKDEIRNCISLFKTKMKQFNVVDKPVDLDDLVDQNMTDFWDLPMEQRWTVYFALLRELQDYLNNKFSTLQQEYASLCGELERINVLVERHALSQTNTKVVGMTTSAASRMNSLLQTLNIEIVVVEEAAEIPEAHVITSLPKTVKHLIMIGDHLQLRPATANYDLCSKSDFEVSLFERLVLSGVPYNSLRLQHRMRPEIAALITPLIYPHLENHERVLQYPPVKGMSANLYFLTHNVLEDNRDKNRSWTSYHNTFEAEMCVKLACHLVKSRYSAEEITLLTLYNGQLASIHEFISRKPELENLVVKVVDSYQGEENRIVILSLVRSNKQGKVGFLNLPNRVCVALSRAREGLYIIGNMEMLRNSCRTWSEIYKVLKKNNAIGNDWPICDC